MAVVSGRVRERAERDAEADRAAPETTPPVAAASSTAQQDATAHAAATTVQTLVVPLVGAGTTEPVASHAKTEAAPKALCEAINEGNYANAIQTFRARPDLSADSPTALGMSLLFFALQFRPGGFESTISESGDAHVGLVRVLLSRGAQHVHARRLPLLKNCLLWTTTLHVAISCLCHADIISMLIDAGADVNEETALTKLAGADVDWERYDQFFDDSTPIEEWVRTKHRVRGGESSNDVLVALLRGGALLDSPDEDYDTAEGTLERIYQFTGRKPEHRKALDIMAAVRAGGGWQGYFEGLLAPHKAVLALRALVARRGARAGPATPHHVVRLLSRSFPTDVLWIVLEYWSATRLQGYTCR